MASPGIACNKLLAKLVSGVHKPDDQTILPPPEAWVRPPKAPPQPPPHARTYALRRVCLPPS